MSTLINIETGHEGYHQVLARVRSYGEERAPRGEPTRDLGHTTVVIHDPHDALPLKTGRKLSRAVAAAEALQLIAMRMDDDLLVKIAPQFEQYREDDGYFHGAYGRRLAAGVQLEHVLRKLRSDRDTRQAVTTLWDPRLDNDPGKRDYPCTVALGFAIQHDRLEMYTTMRSNDVWLGAPYDWFTFTQLQLTLAGVLGIEPGPYTHTAWSLHLYERDLERSHAVAAPTGDWPFQPEGIGSTDDIGGPWDDIVERATVLLTRKTPELVLPEGLTPSEEWFHEQLAPHLG